MAKIDWKTAPEGTTHVDPKDNTGSKWIRNDNGLWLYWYVGEKGGSWTKPYAGGVIPNEERLIPRPTENNQ